MIAASPGLREELAFCDPRGIPHSQFLGGPPVWSDLDRAKALAYARIVRATCSGCGTRTDEHGPDWRNDPQFTAHAEICPGCHALDQARESVPEKHSGWKLGLIPMSEYDPDRPDMLMGDA